MCGIVGKINYGDSGVIEAAQLKAMRDTLAHRGPDDAGLFIDGSVGLGFRRLSIIDLSKAGAQPMSNEDGMIWVVFNGECYNYRELREGLKAKGHLFKSDSDTEVMVHAYEEYGVDFLKQVNGMFSLAVYDKAAGKIFLSVDRFGVKPLYYFAGAGTFIFGSEAKALIADGSMAKELDPAAVRQYFNLGYIAAPRTILKGMRKVKPGHWLELDAATGKVSEQRRYWQLEVARGSRRPADYQAEFEQLFQEAVERRLISDVPLGLFLSGGLDSTAVLMAMDRVGRKGVETFSIGFEEDAFDESKYSRMAAERFRSKHHEFKVRTDAVELLPKLAMHFDEPFDDPSALPTYYLARETRKNVTVALSGDGGDELLAGYPRYGTFEKLIRYQSMLPLGLSRTLAGAAGKMLPDSSKTSRRLYLASLGLAAGYQEHMSAFTINETAEISGDALADDGGCGIIFDGILAEIESDVVTSLQYLDSRTYLPGDILVKVDRASMANSLEVRSPFLDYTLWEKVFSYPLEALHAGGSSKLPLKKMLAPLLGHDFVSRKKMGFGVPLNDWFSGDLRGFADELLLGDKTRNRGYVNMNYAKRILEEHQAGRRDHSRKIWNLLFFEQWCRIWLD